MRTATRLSLLRCARHGDLPDSDATPPAAAGRHRRASPATATRGRAQLAHQVRGALLVSGIQRAAAWRIPFSASLGMSRQRPPLLPAASWGSFPRSPRAELGTCSSPRTHVGWTVSHLARVTDEVAKLGAPARSVGDTGERPTLEPGRLRGRGRGRSTGAAEPTRGERATRAGAVRKAAAGGAAFPASAARGALGGERGRRTRGRIATPPLRHASSTRAG